MALETATLIHQLDAANPAGPDRVANGDDHIRMVKACLKNTFPNINAAVTVTDEVLNGILAQAVPVGLISLWYGSSALCPVGYAICDGNAAVPKSDGSGTIAVPDLRGRVVVGANATHVTGATFGQDSKTVTSDTGGAHSHIGSTAVSGAHGHTGTVDSHVLTIAEIPAHSHDVTVRANSGTGANIEDGDATGGTNPVATSSVGGGLGHTHAATGLTGGDHSHALVADAVPAHAHAVTVDVTQASIALHYIMKV
jgi:microcystin-dependent protein